MTSNFLCFLLYLFMENSDLIPSSLLNEISPSPPSNVFEINKPGGGGLIEGKTLADTSVVTFLVPDVLCPN